jgi:hypothetical protein
MEEKKKKLEVSDRKSCTQALGKIMKIVNGSLTI